MQIEKRIHFAAYLATGVDAFGTGAFISASTIFFSTYNHVSPVLIGLGLTLSAITGMLASLPVASLADRFGNLRIFTLAYCLRAIGMLFWLIIQGDFQFLLFMACFGSIDRSSATLTRSLIIAPLPADQAAILLGKTALPNNLGYGLGAGFSTLLLGLKIGLIPMVMLNATSFLLVILIYRWALHNRLIAQQPAKTNTSLFTTIKTTFQVKARRQISIENFLFSFHRTLLTIYIPLFILHHFNGNSWLAPASFLLNTSIVALFQGRLNQWAVRHHRYKSLWCQAGLLIAITFFLVALFAKNQSLSILIILLSTLIIFQIIAELFSTAALSIFMIKYSRKTALATDLSAINLGGQAQNVIGPTIFGTTAVNSSWIGATAMGILVTLGVISAYQRTKKDPTTSPES